MYFSAANMQQKFAEKLRILLKVLWQKLFEFCVELMYVFSSANCIDQDMSPVVFNYGSSKAGYRLCLPRFHVNLQQKKNKKVSNFSLYEVLPELA